MSASATVPEIWLKPPPSYSVIARPFIAGNSAAIFACRRGMIRTLLLGFAPLLLRMLYIHGLLLLGSCQVGSHKSRGACTICCTWLSDNVVSDIEVMRSLLAS